MRNLIACFLFLLLSLAWTRSLALHITEAFPGTAGDHDVVTFIWNLWWVRHAVMVLHTSPLTTELVFAPFTVDFRIHTLRLLHGLFSIPLQPFFSVIGSFNIILWLTMTLGWSPEFPTTSSTFTARRLPFDCLRVGPSAT